LAKFADSFIKFVIQAMLSDSALKVIRIGLRLVWFMIDNVDDLPQKTNIIYIIQNLTEMFNEEQGRGVIRQEI
jgi:hypothetical protein